MKRRASAAVGATIMLTGGLVACAKDTSGGAGSGDEVTVGAVYLDTQGFYGGVRKGVSDGAKKAGKTVRIKETNAQGDAGKESSFVNTLVNARVDAIILSAVSAEGSMPTVRAAAKSDIPVICYNTCVSQKAMQDYVYAYALGDPHEFGHKLGESAAEYFKEKNITSPKIGVLNCEFVEVCVDRRKGFEKALKEAGIKYTIAANQEGTVLDEAIKVGENILTAHPDLDAFFGESGGATEGAVKAVKNRRRTGKTVVFGSDMTTAIAKALADSSVLKSVVDISGQEMGRVAIQLALDAMDGKKRDKVVEPVNVDLYTKPEDGGDWLSTHPDGIP